MEVIDIQLDTVDSTQTYAQQNQSDFDAKKITCISAEEQTKGRGRFKREWRSPKGVNLYTTFYFQLPSKTKHIGSLCQIMTCSFANVLIKEGICPKIKWPNDIQLSGKKLSGTLCETSSKNDTVDIFLGIGINVNMSIEDLSQIDQPATSLKAETNKEWDRKDLLEKLKKQFASDLDKFIKDGFTPFHSQFENLLAYIGDTVECFDGEKKWTGVCHSITNEGQLNLYLPNGEIKTLQTGDLEVHPS